MAKTIRHEVDKEEKANKPIPHHRRARHNVRIQLAQIDMETFQRHTIFVVDGESKPRGWWTR